MESVYKQSPGFDPKAQTAFSLDLGAPAELPDSLRGEAWQFVQLPLATLVAELEDVRRVRRLRRSTSLGTVMAVAVHAVSYARAAFSRRVEDYCRLQSTRQAADRRNALNDVK